MELMEYIGIFKKDIGTFWFVVFFSVAGAFVWQGLQPKVYDATLLINIGRAGTQETSDYTYDSFYRLQADERFADTVVRWLGSPRIVDDIYAASKLDADASSMRGIKRAFSGKRLSSQMIEVSYSSRDSQMATELSSAIIAVLNRYTESLNGESKEQGWFMVIGSDPVVRDGRIGLMPALLIGLCLGAFVGFWSVFIKHYFQTTKNR